MNGRTFSSGFSVELKVGSPRSWHVLSPAGRVAAITYTAKDAATCANALGWQPPPAGEAADVVRIVNTAIDVCNDRDRPAMAESLEAVRFYVEHAAAALTQQSAAFDFAAHLQRQREWSERTFGPGPRTAGVIDHIRKELREIEAAPHDGEEWIDAVILALDGAWRSGLTPLQIIETMVGKQTKNEGRAWPDWRTVDPDKATPIEHDRTGDQQPAASGPTWMGIDWAVGYEPAVVIATPASTDAIHAAACALAEDFVRGVIESCCIGNESGSSYWYDTSKVSRELDEEDVARALKYLRLIGGEAGDYVATWSTAFPHLIKFTDR